MRAKRVWLAVAGFVLTGCLVAMLFRAGSGGSISLASYQKIKPGMTRAQVEAVLGGPPRREVCPMVDIYCGTRLGEEWWGEEGIITVYFDGTGKVVHHRFDNHHCEVTGPSTADRLRALV